MTDASDIYDTPAPLRTYECVVQALDGTRRKVLMGHDEQDVQTTYREWVILEIREIEE